MDGSGKLYDEHHLIGDEDSDDEYGSVDFDDIDDMVSWGDPKTSVIAYS